jgi:hypothetical protein
MSVGGINDDPHRRTARSAVASGMRGTLGTTTLATGLTIRVDDGPGFRRMLPAHHGAGDDQGYGHSRLDMIDVQASRSRLSGGLHAIWFMGKPFWAFLVVALVAAVPYLGTLGIYFIGDDFGFVQLYAKERFPVNVLSLFWTDWSLGIWGQPLDELRPTQALSYWLDSRWGTDSPLAYHVTNIVIHVLNSLLVLGIGRAAGLSLLAATFAGALFAGLAVHAEAVSWITGRADSIPALMYLLTVLAYALWRQSGTRWLYGVSLAAFFLALFSKQSAITMVGTLVLYDAFVVPRSQLCSPSRLCPDVSFVVRPAGRERRSLRFSLSRVCPYIPFVVLTLGYLVERHFLFQNLVREDRVSLNTFLGFGDFQATQLQILVFGRRLIDHSAVNGLVWLALALGLVWGIAELNQRWKGGGGSPRAVVFYFGVLWWLVSTTPLLVTYFAGRHLYLAAVGPVIALAVLGEVLWSRGRGLWRVVAVAVGVGLIVVSAARLQPAVAAWSTAGSVSEKARRAAERELSAAPSGSLVVLDVPPEMLGGVTHTWLWSFAVPFALQPPYTDVDLTERVFAIVPMSISCCSGSLWLETTRANVEAWAERAEQPPVVILRWDGVTGAMVRRSDAEDPSLRGQVMALAGARTIPEMCAQLNTLLADPGEVRNVCEFVDGNWYLGMPS